MKHQLSVPTITAIRFDHTGASYPSRICWRGKEVMTSLSQSNRLVSFFYDGAYFWLQRQGRSWHIITLADD
jgi:hypothetical protein